MEAGGVQLAWAPDPDPTVVGYNLYYGLASHNYTASLNVGPGVTVYAGGLDAGATYFFAVTAYNADGLESSDSSEVSTTIPLAPVIIVQPSTQIVQAGAAVTLFIDAIGSPPLTFQWYDGASPIAGGTASRLTLSQITVADEGNYNVVVTDPGGSTTSSSATVLVIENQAVTEEIPGTLGAQIQSSGVPLSGKMLAVLASPDLVSSFASVAGAYNGLFYQTNGDGMPAIDADTTGLMSNCVVDVLGIYNGAIYIAGLSNSISGAFDASGNGSATISRSAAGLSDLLVNLHMDLTPGEMQMTGAVTSTNQGEVWTAELIAEPQTNGFAQSPDFLMLIPQFYGFAGGMVTGTAGNGVVSLEGALGDGTTFLQSAPVSANGDLPLFVPLYGQTGLLAGWMNAFCNPSAPLLTWTCLSGPVTSGFTNVFEAAVTPILSALP
jgi:hypothetical protein